MSSSISQGCCRSAVYLMGPIDFVVASAMRGVLERRVHLLALAVFLSVPALACYVVGFVLDQVGNRLLDRSYVYLKGDPGSARVSEEYRVLSWNACMLPYGICALSGLPSNRERLDAVVAEISQRDAEFICLQEVSTADAFALWGRLKRFYAHGYTRVGGMPWSRMESALFFASKYEVLEVRYDPLPSPGWIARGLLSVKTSVGWFLNAHLHSGSSKVDADIRREEIKRIVEICRELSSSGRVVFSCDSNVREDEFSKSGLIENFSIDKVGGARGVDHIVRYGGGDPIEVEVSKVTGASDHPLLMAVLRGDDKAVVSGGV